MVVVVLFSERKAHLELLSAHTFDSLQNCWECYHISKLKLSIDCRARTRIAKQKEEEAKPPAEKAARLQELHKKLRVGRIFCVQNCLTFMYVTVKSFSAQVFSAMLPYS